MKFKGIVGLIRQEVICDVLSSNNQGDSTLTKIVLGGWYFFCVYFNSNVGTHFASSFKQWNKKRRPKFVVAHFLMGLNEKRTTPIAPYEIKRKHNCICIRCSRQITFNTWGKKNNKTFKWFFCDIHFESSWLCWKISYDHR